MLDAALLEKLRHPSSTKTTARCPACAEQGSDRTGNHLAIFPSGAFSCIAHPHDAEHRRRIFALTGIPGDRPPIAQTGLYKAHQATRQREEQARTTLQEKAREARAAIISRHPWLPADVWDDSPQRIDGPLVESDPRHFLATLFKESDLLWTGDTHHSGQGGKYAHHWRSRTAWQQALPATIGPMTTPATWQPGTTSRSAEKVLGAPYTVLDFDGFDGHHPRTPEELEQHLHASLSIIHFIRTRLRWSLWAILWTGSKSLHAWFKTPPAAQLEELKAIAATLGMDAGLIARPEHPCRLPGHPHPKTGQPSRVLWLGA